MQLRWKTIQGTETGTLTPLPGQTVAKAVWMSGLVPAPALCSGLGRCGACRVRFVSAAPAPLPVEHEVLAEDELARGVRLACRHAVAEDMDIELEGVLPHVAPTDSGMLSESLRGVVKLAVDLGTTSIHWKAFNDCGEAVSGKELNPQLGAGSEVMSRVGEALQPGGVHRLAELVTTRLAALCAEAGGAGVVELCVAGNTAMTAILLEQDCSGLAAAPYTRPEVGGRSVRLPSRPDLPPVWIPPQPAPFAGGDVSAGILAVLAGNPTFPLLLADMGTNGEFVLMPDAETLWLTSVPLGPSLEGIGLSRGVLAGPGAVTGFSLGPSGLIPRVLAGEPGAEARAVCGISGTGYLSLMSILRTLGVLDASGIPTAETSGLSPLARRLASGLLRMGTSPWQLPLRLPLLKDLSIMATDVEELIKVRAAFSLAVARLLKAANMRPEDLSAVYLAGALGEHVAPDALEGLGFLPAGLGRRLICAGNTSLAGAVLLLREPERREPLVRLCQAARVLELAGRSDFMADYVARMQLTGFQF